MTTAEEAHDHNLSESRPTKDKSLAAGQPEQYLILAIWFGLITGIGEGLGQMIRIFYLDRIVWMSRDVLWMAPVANILLFSAVGLLLYAVARRWTGIVTLRRAAFIYAFLGFRSLLSLSARFAPYAAALLAVGLAFQTARIIAANPNAINRLLNLGIRALGLLKDRASPRMGPESKDTEYQEVQISRRQFLAGAGAVVGGLTVGVRGWQDLQGRRSLSALPAARPDARNALLIVLDTVRSQSLGLYGYDRPTTPRLEGFAENAVRFERAYSTSPWTLPSHASMFTGRYPNELFNSWWEAFDDTYPTLAEALGEHGYETAGFVANTVFCSYVHGMDRGFTHFEDFRVSPEQTLMSSFLGRTMTKDNLRRAFKDYEIFGRKKASMVNQEILNWLQGRDRTRPFFAFLNYFDAHAPYLPPVEFALQFSPKVSRGYFLPEEDWSEASIKELNDAYDGSIAYLDHQVGLLLDELQDQGVLDDTLVIITSDHGEHFGEHGLMGHANSLYLPLLHVPLVLSFPGHVPSGAVVHAPVSLRDLPATVMDLLEVENWLELPGESLARTLADRGEAGQHEDEIIFSELRQNGLVDPALRERSPLARGNLRSLIALDFHYIRTGREGQEELYDLVNDYEEEINLAEEPEFRPLLDRLGAHLDSLR